MVVLTLLLCNAQSCIIRTFQQACLYSYHCDHSDDSIKSPFLYTVFIIFMLERVHSFLEYNNIIIIIP